MNIDVEEIEKINCFLFQDTNQYLPVGTNVKK